MICLGVKKNVSLANLFGLQFIKRLYAVCFLKFFFGGNLALKRRAIFLLLTIMKKCGQAYLKATLRFINLQQSFQFIPTSFSSWRYRRIRFKYFVRNGFAIHQFS